MDTATAFFLPSALVINVEEIDDQHAELFSRLYALKELCIESGELPALEAEGLLVFLAEHCATEESLAGKAGLNFAGHIRKHQQLLSAIGKAIAEVHDGKMDVFSVLRYIEYWFERHISEEDRILGSNLQQVSDGMFDSAQPFTPTRAPAAPRHEAPPYRH